MATLVVHNNCIAVKDDRLSSLVEEDILYWQTEDLDTDPVCRSLHVHLNPEREFGLSDVERILCALF